MCKHISAGRTDKGVPDVHIFQPILTIFNRNPPLIVSMPSQDAERRATKRRRVSSPQAIFIDLPPSDNASSSSTANTVTAPPQTPVVERLSKIKAFEEKYVSDSKALAATINQINTLLDTAKGQLESTNTTLDENFALNTQDFAKLPEAYQRREKQKTALEKMNKRLEGRKTKHEAWIKQLNATKAALDALLIHVDSDKHNAEEEAEKAAKLLQDL